MSARIARGLAPFLWLIVCVSSVARAAPALDTAVRLGELRGEVSVTAAGSAKAALGKREQTLRAGDRILTGADGWAQILLPDGGRIVVTAGSEFIVRSHDAKRRAGTFALQRGMLRASIPPSAKQPARYRFNTHTAVAGLRGTDFALMHQGPANVFFGNSGQVEVRALNARNTPGADARALTAATAVQTTRGLAPIEPIRIDPDSSLESARALLNAVTTQAPESWVEAGKLPEIVARWNITYSRYLADAGRADEALHVLQVALDLTTSADIQADARLERGAVLGREPGGAEAALREYVEVLRLPTDAAEMRGRQEIALYMSALAQYQLKRHAAARASLQRYQADYPQGRYATRVDSLMRQLAPPDAKARPESR